MIVTPEKLNDREYYPVEVNINGIRYRYRIDASNGDSEKNSATPILNMK